MPLDARLRALCDLMVPYARETVGRHEYDGRVQDLSPDGVRRALAALGAARRSYPGPYDAAQADAAGRAFRMRYGELQAHRSDPMPHLLNLDVSGYDRDYAPAAERAAARDEHLRHWPDAVDAAVAALDRVPAPVAAEAVTAARGLAAAVPPGHAAALAAHRRLLDHLTALSTGDAPAGLDAAALTRLLNAAEATDLDLGRLADRAEAERARLTDRLTEACCRIDPAAPNEATVRRLRAEHPADPVAAAGTVTAEVRRWTRDSGLVPHADGDCRVGPVPESQPWQVATMTWAAPYEPDGPSWFRLAPPRPSWPAADRRAWLSLFHPGGLAAIAIHEAGPGHFAHGRALRRADGDVRRILHSECFVEGWAHYCEELALDAGFRAGDPRLAVAVALDGLLRLTRLACVVGFATGALDTADAIARYRRDVFLDGPAARRAVMRARLEPMTVSYTLGRFAILDARDRARAAWGDRFTLPRFHAALLRLGAPALGLLDHAVSGP